MVMDSLHEVVAVYTAPPRPAHRGKKITLTPVHTLAVSRGLPVYTPASLKDPEVQCVFAQHKADAAVVVAYGLLLPSAILSAYPYGCINIHPSSLPRWRGAAPIQRSIMAGDTETSVCIMQMDAGLDTGAVLMEESHAILSGMTGQELEDELAEKAAPLLIQTLQGVEQGTVFPMPQLTCDVTYAPKILKEECVLDFSRPAHELVNHIHGLSPAPGAYITHQGERLKFLKAEMVNTENLLPPGTVLDEALTIQSGLHGVRPLLLQRQGKLALPADEVLRGFPIPAGTRFNQAAVK